jgi:hypothetical protein
MNIAHNGTGNLLPPFIKGGWEGFCDATMPTLPKPPLTPLYERGELVWWESEP